MNYQIEWLDAQHVHAVCPRLCDILTAVVMQNASVGFMLPVTAEAAHTYWQGVADAVGRGHKHIVVVRNVHGVVVGTAQIEQAASANGQHRAEVMKVLVHPDVQRQGIGTLLMHSIDAFARTRGWRLLILDTKLGDGGEQLYVRCGWIKFGEVPDYAYSPDGTLAGTSFWYKLLT